MSCLMEKDANSIQKTAKTVVARILQESGWNIHII